MKWFTHQAVAMSAAVAAQMPPMALGTVFVGAVLPDIIDQRIAALTRNPQKTFQCIHRGASHWYGWYLVCFLFGLWGTYADVPAFMGTKGVRDNLLLLCLGLGFGGLAHIVLDMLTPMGVPLLPFVRRKRLVLPVCATGSLGEYIFLGVTLCVLFLYVSAFR